MASTNSRSNSLWFIGGAVVIAFMCAVIVVIALFPSHKAAVDLVVNRPVYFSHKRFADGPVTSTSFHDPEIFLMWTTAPSTFKHRQLLVLEAYLYQHPKATLNVYASELPLDFFSVYNLLGYRVFVHRLNDTFIGSLGTDCPGQKWLKDLNKWRQGRYFYSHLTDFLRFCFLYKFGGIYSDFDAIALQPFQHVDNFIGMDNGGSGCDWCISGGNMYLAPGLMGLSKNSVLAKEALQIAFEGDYNPEVFNAVGPQAITKAFNIHRQGVRIYDTHIFYPLPFWRAAELFASNNKSQSMLEKFRRTGTSLHFFGHVSRTHEIEPGSVMYEVERKLRVRKPEQTWTIAGPDYVALAFNKHLATDFRVCAPVSYFEHVNHDEDNSHVVLVDLRIKIGAGSGMGVAVHGMSSLFPDGHLVDNHDHDVGMISNRSCKSLANIPMLDAASASKPDNSEVLAAVPSLEFSDCTIADVNQILSRLVIIRNDVGSARGSLIISVSKNDSSFVSSALVSRVIPIYDLSRVLTIIVKTLDRIEKVFQLVQSVREKYPNVRIVVCDDGENARDRESHSLEFEYVRLPYDVGLSAGRNTMLAMVKTELFLTLDDDFTMGEHSDVGILVHTVLSGAADIAAGKNPRDESKYGFDFSGLIDVVDNSIKLSAGNHGPLKDGQCVRVEITPNLFVARADTILSMGAWDADLKVGEHEDFFLRAKWAGLRVATCASVEFYHDQTTGWFSAERKSKYDTLRGRVYDFWRVALQKHGLTRLVSFGDSVMLDLTPIKPVVQAWCSELLDTSLLLSWIPVKNAHRYRVEISELIDEQNSQIVGREATINNIEQTSLQVISLEAGKRYRFTIVATDPFENYFGGYTMTGRTLSVEEARGILINGGFENGTNSWQHGIGTTFHSFERSAYAGDLSGRLQIHMSAYLSKTPATMTIQQTVMLPIRTKSVIVSAWSSIEELFGDPSTITYRISAQSFQVNQTTGKHQVINEAHKDFAVHVLGWQLRSFTMCFVDTLQPIFLTVTCTLGSHRGAVLFDDVRVVPLSNDRDPGCVHVPSTN